MTYPLELRTNSASVINTYGQSLYHLSLDKLVKKPLAGLICLKEGLPIQDTASLQQRKPV